MKNIFASYPEVVCVDATYKLLELRFPVYIMLIEDGNGEVKSLLYFYYKKRLKSRFLLSLIYQNPASSKVRITLYVEIFERGKFSQILQNGSHLQN